MDILAKKHGVSITVLRQTRLKRILDTWMKPPEKYGVLEERLCVLAITGASMVIEVSSIWISILVEVSL